MAWGIGPLGKPGFLAEMGQRFAGAGSMAGPSTAFGAKGRAKLRSG